MPAAGNPEVYRTLALVPEREAVQPFLTGLRVRAHVRASFSTFRDVDAATERAIALVDLADAQDRRVGTYSKGMRQRIKIAGAIVHDPASCCSTSRSTAWIRGSAFT